MLDSGASAYMTDQPSLFRGLRKVISKRYIKVSSSFLYLVEIGTVALQDKHRNKCLINHILYVPGLRVNLISGRKLCSDYGLIGVMLPTSFLLVNQSFQALAACKALNSVYVINKIKGQ